MRRHVTTVVAAGALAVSSWAAVAGHTLADNAPSPWARARTPAPGPPQSIGDYSSGCLQGATALPLDGPGFQVMHPSRHRHYGHPHLVDFVQKLGQQLHDKHQSVVLVGDLSQPRGGRATGGHASHQTGLDVDLWFWHPPSARDQLLTTQQREELRSRSVLNGKTKSIRAQWAEQTAQMLEIAAKDARVERIFVHPIIKRQLCQEAQGERAWLGKLRPWYGHDDHFHVRLACPADSPDCVPQDAVAQGDGCGEDLDWWFDEKAQADRKKARKTYQRKVRSKPTLPERCQALID